MLVEEKITILEANLARQLQWITSADSKSNFIFTISIAMLGILAAIAPDTASSLGFWSAFVCAVAVALIAGAIFCAAHTVFPRTDGPVSSLIYCRSIADCGIKDFRDRMNSVQYPDYTDDLIIQCFRNASIASVKFTWVKRGLICLYASSGPWACVTWLFYQAPP
jgi:hypothetical protein